MFTPSPLFRISPKWAERGEPGLARACLAVSRWEGFRPPRWEPRRGMYGSHACEPGHHSAMRGLAMYVLGSAALGASAGFVLAYRFAVPPIGAALVGLLVALTLALVLVVLVLIVDRR
jgi:hypothetical protein